jgi:hypothetical protein
MCIKEHSANGAASAQAWGIAPGFIEPKAQR